MMEAQTNPIPELAVSLRAPNRRRARWGRAGSYSALAFAGYLRFDAGYAVAGRLIALIWIGAVLTLLWRFTRSAQLHYDTHAWALEFDLGGIREHQRAKSTRAALLTRGQYRSEVVRALGQIAVQGSLPFYGLLILAPVSVIGNVIVLPMNWLF